MALKLLTLCKGTALCLQRSLNSQAGVIIHQNWPSTLGFKVRLLASSSGGGGLNNFRLWTAQRPQMLENDRNNGNLIKRKPSSKGLSTTNPNVSQKQSKTANLPRKPETKSVKTSSFTQSLKRKGERKAKQSKDPLKAYADSLTPFKTIGTHNGLKYSFRINGPGEIPQNGNVRKNRLLDDAPGKGKSLGYKNTTSGKKQAKTRVAHSQAQGGDTSLPEKGRYDVKGSSNLKPRPEPMSNHDTARASLQALNLETVSKSMGHLSSNVCPTDLQNRDISQEDRALPMEENPKAKKRKFVKHQNQGVSSDALERKWERKEEESLVNLWGQAPPWEWPEATFNKILPENQSKTISQSSIATKSSSASGLKTGLGFKSSPDVVSELNPASKRPIPEPLLYVTPEEIVKSKFVSPFNKESASKNSIDTTFKSSRSPRTGKSVKKTKPTKSHSDTEVKLWFKDIRQSLQAKAIAKSKAKSKKGLARDLQPDINKQRSPRSTIHLNSIDKPITKMTSRDLLTDVTARATNKTAVEKVGVLNKKDLTPSAHKPTQQQKQQQLQQHQQQQHPQWKPHVALEPSTRKDESNAVCKDQKDSLQGQSTSSIKKPASIFLEHHDALPGIIKSAPITQTKADKADKIKHNSTSKKTKSRPLDHRTVLECVNKNKSQPANKKDFILSSEDVIKSAPSAQAKADKATKNKNASTSTKARGTDDRTVLESVNKNKIQPANEKDFILCSEDVIKSAPSAQAKADKATKGKNASTSTETENTDDPTWLESVDAGESQPAHNNAFILCSDDVNENMDRPKVGNTSSVPDSRNETSSKRESLAQRIFKDQPTSKNRSPRSSKMSTVKNTAAKPMADDILWPTDENIVFPLGGRPATPSGIYKKSDFPRDVCNTYLGNKVTSQEDFPAQVSYRFPNEKEKVKSRDDSSGMARFPSAVGENFQTGIKKNDKTSVRKVKSLNEVNDTPTFGLHPGIDSTVFDTLDGFMAMEAKEVKYPLTKKSSGQKPLPLFPNNSINTDLCRDLSSRIREPVWTMTRERVKAAAAKNSNSLFRDDQLRQYEYSLAKYHDRAKQERMDRRSKKDSGKRDKGKKKIKREKKNSRRSYADNKSIYI